MEPQAKIAIDLVDRIGAGDAAAESELFERFAKGIQLILLKRTGNRQLASDLCQDTFVIALQKLRNGQLHKPESLLAFLRQTAVNLSIEHFRKERRYIHQEDGIISLQAAPRDRKAERIDHRRARSLLNEVIEKLAQHRDRAILQRFYLLDQDKTQICAALELSGAHFDRVLYRAKKRMSEMIENQPELKSLLYGSLCDD